MHRTTGAGYEIIGDKRFNVNQDLGAEEPGTRDMAEDTNAMQEELCNAIVRGGLEVIGDDDPENAAALDEAAGWDQLATAIFDSEAIDTEAIADGAITPAKFETPLSGGISIRAGASGTKGLYLNSAGVKYPDGPGESDTMVYRKALYNVNQPTLTWAEQPDASNSGKWEASLSFETDIPSADVAIDSIFRLSAVFLSVIGTPDKWFCCPVHASIDNTGGYIRFYNITVYGDPTYIPSTTYKLIVEYDAQNLT